MVRLLLLLLLPGCAAHPATLGVRVVSLEGTPLDGAQVSVASEGGTPVEARTDGLGVARFEGLGAGRTSITVRSPGFRVSRRFALLGASEVIELVIGLELGMSVPGPRWIVSGRIGSSKGGKTIVAMRFQAVYDSSVFADANLRGNDYVVELPTFGLYEAMAVLKGGKRRRVFVVKTGGPANIDVPASMLQD